MNMGMPVLFGFIFRGYSYSIGFLPPFVERRKIVGYAIWTEEKGFHNFRSAKDGKGFRTYKEMEKHRRQP